MDSTPARTGNPFQVIVKTSRLGISDGAQPTAITDVVSKSHLCIKVGNTLKITHP